MKMICILCYLSFMIYNTYVGYFDTSNVFETENCISVLYLNVWFSFKI
jgi:hypothetical protein